MKPLPILTENQIKFFLKAATVDDVEVYMNGIVLARKHNDRDKGNTCEYIVKITDSAPENSICYEVGSNAIGLEAIRKLTRKHNITDGGSESSESKFIGIYI